MSFALVPSASLNARQKELRNFHKIAARLADWRPGLVVVSAGFDAHAADPLAQLDWDDADFAAVTRMICDMAAGCAAPVVSCLEGGYDLAALGRSTRAHVQVLLEAGT